MVTGTFEPLTLEEMDRAIRVLPVRDRLATLNTLVDVLRLDPSLDVAARAPDGVQNDVSIRGAGFGQTLVLLNGQRLNDAQSGHHNMDIPVPLGAVKRVEVLRGSGSTLYGSDAAGGILNVITGPPEGMELRLRTAVGSFGTNRQSGSVAGGWRGIGEQATFSRDFSTGFRPDRDYRNLAFGSGTTWTGGGLTLGYMDHPFGADQFYGNYTSWENTKTWFAGVRQELGERTGASFAFRRHSDLFVLYRDRPEVFTNHHSDWSYQGAVRRREELAAGGALSVGVEGLHEAVRSTNLGDHQRSRGAAYAALDFRALRRFSLTVAAREEVYRRFSGTFSPTISGGLWISGKLKVRASASRAFRVPGYTDLYYHDPANLGSPSLRPERAWTYEGGADWMPHGRVRAEMTVFERRLRDGIDYQRSSPNDIWRALNIQNLNFTGVEAGVRVAAAVGQTVDFRYTGLRGRLDTVPAGFTKYTFNYPRHSAVAAWQAGLSGGWMVRSRLGGADAAGSRPVRGVGRLGRIGTGLAETVRAGGEPFGHPDEEIPGVAMPGRSLTGGVELVFGHP